MVCQSRCAVAVLAAGLTVVSVPAGAAWLHCSVTGSDSAGNFEYLTTLANVGKVPPARLQQFQARVAAYVVKADPESKAMRAVCFAPDDQLDADKHYSRLLTEAAARVGWDRVTVLVPRDWLAEADIVDEPAQP